MSHPIPLREVRKTSRTAIPVSLMAWLLSDGTCGCTGDDVAPDRATAQKAWPHYRRQVWAYAHVGHVPMAAQVHDGLTTSGFGLLWETWRTTAYSLQDVLSALAADRAAVQAFERTDPKGAREIADYLTQFRAYLDRVEAAARKSATVMDRSRADMPDIAYVGRYGDNEER